MIPTSDERREVAQMLRIEVRDKDTSLDYPVHRIINDVLGVNGAWGDKAARILADMIDPTCYLVDTTSTDGLHGPIIFSHELSCGHTCETFWQEPPAHCTECGARVVGDDDQR